MQCTTLTYWNTPKCIYKQQHTGDACETINISDKSKSMVKATKFPHYRSIKFSNPQSELVEAQVGKSTRL